LSDERPGVDTILVCPDSGVNATGADAENLGVDPRAPLARCGDCPLKDRPCVIGYGPRLANWIIVGEAPGETEVL
jgi:uracil-DNA glycosylase